MSLHVLTNYVLLPNGQIPHRLFGRLVQAHLRHCPNTPSLELAGIQLIAANFPEEQLRNFISDVCVWGGYPGIAGRVLNQNPIATIRARFQRAVMKLEHNDTNVGEALEEVNCIRGLGTPSFASKHLRFLHPATCPVLDSTASERLNYQFDQHGYISFANDCSTIAEKLKTSQIVNPRNRDGNAWFIADVESAIFAFLKGW